MSTVWVPGANALYTLLCIPLYIASSADIERVLVPALHVLIFLPAPQTLPSMQLPLASSVVPVAS
jgi:hypothetical protein